MTVRGLHGITSRPHVLFVETFLDSPDSVFGARGDDLLPLGYWLPCSARVIAADVAALRACEEVLGCRSREISEARIVHGLSQAQGVISNLLGKRLGEPPCARIAMSHHYNTYIFGSPQFSGKERLGAAFALPGGFGLLGRFCGGGCRRWLQLRRKSGLDVPD